MIAVVVVVTDTVTIINNIEFIVSMHKQHPIIISDLHKSWWQSTNVLKTDPPAET